MTKVALTVRLASELKDALNELARLERRTVTAEVEDLIQERAKKCGLLPKEWKAAPIRGRTRD